MKRFSAGWCCLLAALLLSLPLLAAKTVGEGVSTQRSTGGGLVETASVPSLLLSASPVPTPAPSAVLSYPSPVPLPAPTVAPPPVPPPLAVQPPPDSAGGLCADAISVNVVDADLTGVVQAGVDLLTEYFGCRKFHIDGTGLRIKFGEITPIFNARVLGYADSTSAAYEIWLNRDCWGLVQSWDAVVAHELGHYLGWRHGDEHPYMWLTPPAGSYAQPGDLAIVCY